MASNDVAVSDEIDAQPLQERRTVVMVHVNHGDAWVPFGQDRLGLDEVVRGANLEEAMVERQPNEVDDRWAIVEDERAPWVV